MHRPELGRIETGHAADLVLYDANDIAFAGAIAQDPLGALMLCNPPRPVRVIIAGKTVVENSQVVGVDWPKYVADFNQLIQVFVNLAVNAFQAMDEGNKLTIRSSTDNDGRVMISFHDTGYGISPENMENLFTPFFTTKDEVKGVGLGLAISHGIIERHGGSIEVESEVGKGSTFTIILPGHKEESPSGA